MNERMSARTLARTAVAWWNWLLWLLGLVWLALMARDAFRGPSPDYGPGVCEMCGRVLEGKMEGCQGEK